MEAEIEKLPDTLMGASATLLSCVNAKIEELDTRRQGLYESHCRHVHRGCIAGTEAVFILGGDYHIPYI